MLSAPPGFEALHLLGFLFGRRRGRRAAHAVAAHHAALTPIAGPTLRALRALRTLWATRAEAQRPLWGGVTMVPVATAATLVARIPVLMAAVVVVAMLTLILVLVLALVLTFAIAAAVAAPVASFGESGAAECRDAQCHSQHRRR